MFGNLYLGDKNQAENKLRKKMVQKSLSQHKIIEKLHSVEEESLLMQYHSINIEELPKRIKN